MERTKGIRFYKNEYPQIDDLVYAKITEVNEVYITVILPEYNNIQAMIMLNEVSRVVTSHLKKKYKIGNCYVCRVLNVDDIKGFIDLTKKRVSDDESIIFVKKYKTNKKIIKLVKDYLTNINNNKNININIDNFSDLFEEFMEKTFWSLGEDNYLNILNDANYDVNLFGIENNKDFMEYIKNSLCKKEEKVNALFTLLNRDNDGIEYVKRLLKNCLKLNTSEEKIKIHYIKSSEYLLTCISNDTNSVIKTMKLMLEYIKDELNKKNENYYKFNIVKEPYILENNEQ